MNSLEFIDREIECLQDMISMDLALVEDEFDLQEIGIKQKRLKELQQIKAELEAWYLVKPSIHHIKGQRCFVIHNIYKNEQYDFIMKGLKNNRN